MRQVCRSLREAMRPLYSRLLTTGRSLRRKTQAFHGPSWFVECLESRDLLSATPQGALREITHAEPRAAAQTSLIKAWEGTWAWQSFEVGEGFVVHVLELEQVGSKKIQGDFIPFPGEPVIGNFRPQAFAFKLKGDDVLHFKTASKIYADEKPIRAGVEVRLELPPTGNATMKGFSKAVGSDTTHVATGTRQPGTGPATTTVSIAAKTPSINVTAGTTATFVVSLANLGPAAIPANGFRLLIIFPDNATSTTTRITIEHIISHEFTGYTTGTSGFNSTLSLQTTKASVGPASTIFIASVTIRVPSGLAGHTGSIRCRAVDALGDPSFVIPEDVLIGFNVQ